VKSNLPWLDATQRNRLFRQFEANVERELLARDWGAIRTPRRGAFGHPVLHILDMRGLLLAAGLMRYLLRQVDTRLYYRGQARAYEHLTLSLYRNPTNLMKAERQLREEHLERQLDAIKGVFDINPRKPAEREALAQHYGLRTRCLDVIDHVQTAAWFAYDRLQQEDTERRDAVGHIYLLAADAAGEYVEVIDLRMKPSNWLRPHLQQALMLFRGPRAQQQTDFDFACAAHFIVPRPLLQLWSGYQAIPHYVMFPTPEQDQGAYYWQNALDALTTAGLSP